MQIGMCGRPDQMAKLHKLVSVSEDLGTKLLLKVKPNPKP